MRKYINIFWQLLKTDLLIYKSAILGGFIDASIWFSSLIVVFAFVYPLIGMSTGFGNIIAISAIVSCSFWDTWATSTTFVSDITGNKTINYYLTLPIPNSLVLIKQVISYAIKAGIPSLIILPLAKLFLWNSLLLSNFAPIKFFAIFILINLFVGSFSLFITSMIKSMHHLNQIGVRFLFPLWFFGCTNYSWATINKLSKALGYISLFNPLTYASEGIRAATLGQQGNLPYSLCFVALVAFTCIFTLLGTIKLKKRLDFAG